MAQIHDSKVNVTHAQICNVQGCYPTVEIHHESDKVVRETPKISLLATKVSVRKTGMNSGISGGGYQCC